jgi:trimeric autotransporter adhesin
MKRATLALALLTATCLATATPWTYRGTLNDGGKPANGNYDVRLTLIDAKGTASISAPITLLNVPVKEGNFSAEVDFGIDLSQAPAMQLKTEVAQGNSGFVSLGEATIFDPKAALAGICWDTTGNVVAAGEFLGASNDVGVEIKANNLRAARFKAAGTAAAWGDAPQVVLGSAANSASNVGATVGGGGATRDSTGQVSARENTAGNRFATVAGGLSNNALGAVSVISGGEANTASGTYAVVGGGNVNRAVGANSVVSGGFFNCAGGDNSWAGGTGAVVRQPSGPGNCTPISGFNGGDSGTFVWADSQVNGGFFTSSGQNQFLVRAEGGMAINTNTPAAGASLTVNGNVAIANPGSVAFGASTRQMLNMFNADYGIGVQAARMYFRVATTGGFNWFEGGVHSDAVDNAGGGTRRMNLSSSGQLTTTTGTISTISDGRLKTGVYDYTGALDQIAQLRPVHYRYINAGKADFQPMGEHLGFIAQDVQKVFPQWVNSDDSGYLSLSMRGFEAVAVRAMQELQAENNAKTSEIAALKARLDALEAKLSR